MGKEMNQINKTCLIASIYLCSHGGEEGTLSGDVGHKSVYQSINNNGG